MNRKERTRILVEGSRKVLSRMACEAEQLYAVAMVREPTEELVMLKVREGAQCSLFYLGEALMTSCAVRIGGAHGYGMVLGEDRKKARDLAIVEEERQRLAEAEQKRAEALLRTQVDFSTMEV